MTDTKKQNTEQAILDAAEAEFFEKGFYGATTAGIAKRAGVTHAMLHYYFRTKENIFQMFVSRQMNNVKGIIMQSLFNGGLSFPDRIRKMIGSQFEFFSSHRELPRFMVNEVLTNPEYFRQIVGGAIEQEGDTMLRLQDDIDREVEAGNIRPVSFVNLMIDIMSLNVFSFLLLPARDALPGGGMSENEFLEMRKRENIEVILSRLKK